jgi:hypothetical protein
MKRREDKRLKLRDKERWKEGKEKRKIGLQNCKKNWIN